MGEKQSQDPKVCVECKVEKHGRSFDPGCKKCNSCRYKQQKENQTEDPKVCAECKVKKHGLSFKPGCNKCSSCYKKQQRENQSQNEKFNRENGKRKRTKSANKSEWNHSDFNNYF